MMVPFGKGDFVDVIRLRTLSWGSYFGLSEWAPNATSHVLIKEAEGVCVRMHTHRLREMKIETAVGWPLAKEC